MARVWQYKRVMQIPTIHLNGSSAEVLREQYAAAYRALDEALRAICETNPNMRDYYVQGPDAGSTAKREHDTRVEALRKIRAEIAQISEGIEEQLDERARHREAVVSTSFVIALCNNYGDIKSKFSTYASEELALTDLDRAAAFGQSYGPAGRRDWHPRIMSEAEFDQKLKRQRGDA